MLGIENIPLFLVAAVLLALTPGPDTLYVLTRSVVRGRREGVLSVAGISCGLVIHALLAAFGVSAFLATSATAFSIVKYLGVAYLLYLGVRSLWLAGAEAEGEAATPRSSRRTFWQGFLTNVLNPKVALFFLALLPQFVSPTASAGVAPFLVLGLIVIAIGASWLLVVAALAHQVGKFLQANRVALERFAGVVYIGLALRLSRA